MHTKNGVERSCRRLFSSPKSSLTFLMALAIAFGLALAPATHAATSGTGTVSATVGKFVELSVTDATIAAFSASPTSSDPGPVVKDNTDHFRFSNVFSNTRAMFSMDITSATDGSASATKTIQGTTHTIADWVYLRQDANQKYGTYETTGVYDASAASYTAPGGFTKDSQGTFQIKTYDKDSPTDGGDSTITVNWIYESAGNRYYFDAVDKDFTNGNGEAQVNPSSKTDQASGYTYTAGTNAYGVTSVANSGSNYVPTVRMAWQVDYSTAASVTKDAYVLIDFPSGTPADTYSITLTATVTQLTS
ncbi:MAG: hypothetical protein KY455_01410 [Euryarchaeota archaeon]|nr:hypothetical protein [Euryarchaeota archaeon]